MNLRYVTATALMILCVSRTSFAAEPVLIAIGSINGQYEDFATETAGRLPNNVPGNRLGGIGSGLAHLGGDWFVAIPDRGLNAVPYNACMDDTVSYINRFHTMHLSLSPSDPGSVLPFTLTPMLAATTLLSSRAPLVYGAGCGTQGSGVPALNAVHEPARCPVGCGRHPRIERPAQRLHLRRVRPLRVRVQPLHR